MLNNNLSAAERKGIAEKTISDMREIAKKTFSNLSRREMEARESEVKYKAEEERTKADKERQDTMSDYDGYAADKTPMERGRIRNILDRSDNIYLIKQKAAEEGTYAKEVTLHNGKKAYRIYHPDGSFISLANRTEYNYFNYLKNQQADNKKAADNSGKIDRVGEFTDSIDCFMEGYSKGSLTKELTKEAINNVLEEAGNYHLAPEEMADVKKYAKNAKAKLYSGENDSKKNAFENIPATEIKTEILRIANDIWSGTKPSNQTVRFYPSQKLRNAVKDILGKDIKQVFITDSQIKHIKDHHGTNEANRGQVDMKPELIPDVYDVVQDFDTIKYTEKSGVRGVELTKDIDGIHHVIMIENGEIKISLKTSFKEKQATKKSPKVVDANVPDPNVRNVPTATFSNSSVSQEQQEVKENQQETEVEKHNRKQKEWQDSMDDYNSAIKSINQALEDMQVKLDKMSEKDVFDEIASLSKEAEKAGVSDKIPESILDVCSELDKAQDRRATGIEFSLHKTEPYKVTVHSGYLNGRTVLDMLSEAKQQYEKQYGKNDKIKKIVLFGYCLKMLILIQ